MPSVSMTGTQTGAGIVVKPGEVFTFDVTGTFTGTVVLERRLTGQGWETIRTTTADTPMNGSQRNDGPNFDETYRFRGVVATGTAVGTTNPIWSPGLVGVKNGATVSVVESVSWDVPVHRTRLTMNETPITLTDDAGVGQFGGVKVYDFPAGNILVLGAVLDAECALQAAAWVDTAAGDVAVGSGVPADATALDGTAVDIVAETAVAAMAAQVGPIDCQSAAPVTLGSAGGTDDIVNVNLRIDDNAAHVTDSGLLTGTLELAWINLGDF